MGSTSMDSTSCESKIIFEKKSRVVADVYYVARPMMNGYVCTEYVQTFFLIIIPQTIQQLFT